MSPRAWSVRAAGLIGAGALAVHHLRYAISYRGHTDEALASQGHAYLADLTPAVGALLVLALGSLLRRAATGRGTLPDRLSFGRTWAICGSCLVSIHFLQEWLESLLCPGHPGGVVGLVEHGGGAAVLLAMAIGVLIALALRGAATATRLARGATPLVLRPAAPPVRVRLPGVRGPALAGLAHFLAARGPPLGFE
jgi:hypothetical protein